MLTAAVVGLALVVAVLGLLVVGLLRSHAEILRQLHDLGAGDTVADTGAPRIRTRPGVALPRGQEADATDVGGLDPAGGATHVAVTGVEHRTLLAFLSSGCLTCREFWDAFGEPGSLGLRDGVRLVAVTRGPANESPASVAALAPRSLTTVMSDEAWDAYEVPVAPYFVLVDGPSGQVIGEGASARWDQVRELMHQALDDTEPRGPSWPPRPGSMGERDRFVDDELARAGIEPGHASLHPEPHPDHR